MHSSKVITTQWYMYECYWYSHLYTDISFGRFSTVIFENVMNITHALKRPLIVWNRHEMFDCTRYLLGEICRARTELWEMPQCSDLFLFPNIVSDFIEIMGKRNYYFVSPKGYFQCIFLSYSAITHMWGEFMHELSLLLICHVTCWN